MTSPVFAWILNLDADLELAAGGNYTPRKHLRAAMAPHIERLAQTLLGPGDYLIERCTNARPAVGRAFCPTPTALAALRLAGAEPEPSPPFEVLRRVNSRKFASSLGATLPWGKFVLDWREAEDWLAQRPVPFESWRVKRAFGMAGRGQRTVTPGKLSHSDKQFVVAGLRQGGLQIEPQVIITREFGLHGMLHADGSVLWGSPVEQRCDAHGVWLETVPLADVDSLLPFEPQLWDSARLVAKTLYQEGYFGPFGIDAYSYRDPQGGQHFQPRSEVNARYSMGFPVGFAGRSRGNEVPSGSGLAGPRFVSQEP